MTEISIDERRLEICSNCIGRTNPPSEAHLTVMGSSWDGETDVDELPILVKHEIATRDAHLGSVIIANEVETPDDSVTLLDCVVEATRLCDDQEPVELSGYKFCPALIEATELFYQQTGRS